MLTKLTTTLLLLLASTSALAHPQTQPTAGTCKTTHLPTESEYEIGYRSFCATYLPPGRKHYITEGAPLVATFDLTAHDNKPLKWIYKISISDRTPLTQMLEADEASCVQMFRGLLQGGVDAEGVKGGNRLGENYCVVGGEGVVLVQGGSVWVEGLGPRGRAVGVWESRERKG